VTEAQVSGIPLLASDRGGLPESVGPGGILLPVDAPLDDWLVAFDRLWSDREAHRTYSELALAHARRPTIQPGQLAKGLVDAVVAHYRETTGSMPVVA
jgi:glycosyltransferase involved in cell wall biosynthesis